MKINSLEDLEKRDRIRYNVVVTVCCIIIVIAIIVAILEKNGIMVRQYLNCIGKQ